MPLWHVGVDASKQKAKNVYDVIIVGGGFGGLSCGSLLAKHGYKVLLLEKNPTVGGLCSSYPKFSDLLSKIAMKFDGFATTF